MVWNRVKFFRKNGRRNYKHNPISKWVFSAEAAHPAIVTKEIFEPVAMKFLGRSESGRGRPGLEHDRGNGSPYNSSRYLPSGLMECSECKANYVTVKTVHKGKSSQVYFGCNAKERWGKKKCPSKRVSLTVAEGVIMDTLLNQLLNERAIAQFIATLQRVPRERKRLFRGREGSGEQGNQKSGARDREFQARHFAGS